MGDEAGSPLAEREPGPSLPLKAAVVTFCALAAKKQGGKLLGGGERGDFFWGDEALVAPDAGRFGGETGSGLPV